MASTGNDQSVTFSYNPASQITSLTKTNDAYAWTGHGNGSTASVANGLNQLTSIGGTATTHDTKGNVTFDPMSGKTYAYSSENLLTSSSGGTAATLAYDPAMRLYQVAAGATTRFQYDGVNLIADYDGSTALQHRYVFGPAADEPLVQYDGSGTSNRSWLHSDERGSIIAISDGTGAVTTINKYDEYGKPQATNAGRLQYTGQVWLAEIDGYYYKARIYSPVFGGRFLQTDPIGISGGINLYAYVGNDPVNYTDPLGLLCWDGSAEPCTPIVVQGGCVAIGGCRNFTGDKALLNSAPLTYAPREGTEGGGASTRKNLPNCETKLPNGRSLGDVIREKRAILLYAQAHATDYGNASPMALLLTVFADIVRPNGDIDFKNNYSGDREILGHYGNFAYYSIGSGIIATSLLDAGAGAYGIYSVITGTKPLSDLSGPMLSDYNAAEVRDPALESKGCPK